MGVAAQKAFQEEDCKHRWSLPVLITAELTDRHFTDGTHSFKRFLPAVDLSQVSE